MNLSDIHLPYALPTALLITGLALKSATIIRSWKDPNARATWLVLFFASAVFVSVTPASLQKINDVTDVANIAAPWSYSMLTAFCGACLTMIITWREVPSRRRTRRIRSVWIIYGALVVALWVTFLLADVPVVRIYDIDTYYATTPWMREHILLYLFGYLTSTLVSAWMIWTWISEVRNKPWLKAGLICLQVGYAMGLVFDFAKLTAIGARWAGTDWDYLSVTVAPPFAILGGTLVALGFILPVVGPVLQQWPRDQISYWILRSLIRAFRDLPPSAALARVGRFAPLDLRLLQREQQVLDGLLQLAPYYDPSLYEEAYEQAVIREGATQARGLAGAVAIRAALVAHANKIPRNTGSESPRIGPEVTDHITLIARSLLRPHRVVDLYTRLTSTGSATAHA
ncbi:MAB_1171c family putative transporter [Streptomyces sp. NPDC090493]|uniref:MAB_1171c family putative transporter n=1 Tax=Streptomyces sp. NPDC090493 TaxID=3365964 RepID=UPI0037FC7B82